MVHGADLATGQAWTRSRNHLKERDVTEIVEQGKYEVKKTETITPSRSTRDRKPVIKYRA